MMQRIANLRIGELCDAREIILRASCDAIKEDPLRDASTQHHAHPVQKLLNAVQVVLLWQVLCIAESRRTARDDGHLQ